jgi:toxin ParE1/3/4
MRRIIYAPEARADLGAIGAYITEHAGDIVAESFLDRIRLGIENMAIFPGSRPLVPELGVDLRRQVVGRYLIFYRFDEEAIHIVRVLHGARNITAELFEA